MNQTIKNRINQIKSGQVPEGYKNTQVGIVPIEWKEDRLSNIFDFKNGLNKEKEAFGKGLPIVNYTDVWKKRGLRVEDIKGLVELSPKERNNYNVKEGDVFFTRTSETKEEIGLTTVILEEVKDTVFSGFILRARPKNKRILKEYNQYCYSSQYMRDEIIKKSSITTRALTNGKLLGQVNINLPNQTEQAKIAEILMKWDEAIEAQEQLIQKLEIRKKALMQKLLTPKEGWKIYNLGAFIKVKSGYAFKSESYCLDGLFKVITIKNVQQGKLDLSDLSLINEMPNNLQPHQILKENEIIISLTGNVGRSCYITEKNCLLNQRVGKIEIHKGNKKYIYAVLQSSRFIYKMQTIAQGCAQSNLSNSDIEEYLFYTPMDKFGKPNLEEQKRIGDILSLADKEIELHKQHLDQLIKQRRSMMQLLLTGIVRTVTMDN